MTIGIQRTFDDLGAPLFGVPFCVLDLETTGGSPAECEITEVGAVKYRAGELVGTFHSLVDPGMPIPPTITVLTGITHAMVVDAPRIAEVLPALLEFIGESVIVGHNIRFDVSFLNAAAERLGYGRLTNRTADTLGLARRLVGDEVRGLGLQSLATHFRSPVRPVHRALEDAKATAHVFFELLERAGTLGVTHLEDLMRLPTARGRPHYDKIALTDGLPRLPGVYIFRDKDGAPLYVGKAKNLRSRVRAYFYGDPRRSVTQMLRNLAKVEHRVCETELEAEVAELRLIHALTPRYNRRSRRPRSTYWVKVTREKYPRLSMVRTLRSDGLAHIGPFRSKHTAEAVLTAIWDAVPIRRCIGKSGKRSAACQFGQLGVALCPCDGNVADDVYSEVVTTVVEGLTRRPDLLLSPLAEKMLGYARGERFEEAAVVRDRHRALAHALDARRRWQALMEAGRVSAESVTGEGAHIEQGRLVAAWQAPDPPPLFTVSADLPAAAEVGPSIAAAEEAALIWGWLDSAGVQMIDSTRPLSLPSSRVARLGGSRAG